MMPRYIILKTIVPICILSLFFTSCEKQQNTPPGEAANYGSFQLVADEVLKPVIDSLVTGFMIENPNAKVTVKYTSATEAVRELINHDARAIIIDRTLTPQERALITKDSVTIPEYKMADDGIACMVPVADKEQLDAVRLSYLRSLFGNPKTPETTAHDRSYVAQKKIFSVYPSSIEYALDSIMGVEQTGGLTERYQTTDSVITRVAGSRNDMGFVSSAWKHWIESQHDTSVKFLAVIPHDLSSEGVSEPVLLNMVYIAEGAYPLVTRVTGYSFDVPNTVPRGFLAYASTAHGQMIFKNFDVLPTTQPIRIVPSK